MLVRHLGLKPYSEVMAMQFSLMRRRALGEAPDTLLLAQHPSVYTRGVACRQKPAHKLPYPLRTVDREGGLFYHGPGQLAGYPIFDKLGFIHDYPALHTLLINRTPLEWNDKTCGNPTSYQSRITSIEI